MLGIEDNYREQAKEDHENRQERKIASGYKALETIHGLIGFFDAQTHVRNFFKRVVPHILFNLEQVVPFAREPVIFGNG